MVTDRKAQIIEEASKLFAKEGFDGVTVRILAAACGISEPALYRHFASKEAIFDAVLSGIPKQLDTAELFEKLSSEDDLESLLKGLAGEIIRFYSNNVGLYRLLLFAVLGKHPMAGKVFNQIRGTYVKFLIDQLDRLHAKDLIVEKNNIITARCFIGMVFDCSLSTTLWKGFLGKSYKQEDIIDNNIPIYVRGLKIDVG